MGNKTESKTITVCIGAFPESAFIQCNEKVKKLQAAGFKDAKVAESGRYICVCAGEYDTKEKAAEAMKELKKMGFNPYELAA